MTKRLFLSLALLSFVACGGGSKSDDTAPAGGDLEATPVEPAAEETAPAETEAETEAAETAEADAGGVCPTLCDRILACAVEMGGQQPSDEQMAQAKEQCGSQCAEEQPDKLEAAGKCVADNPDSCPGLFQCLQPLQES